jgi:flagellar motor switch protein FliN
MLVLGRRGSIQPRLGLGVCMNTLDTIEVDITVELGATTMPIHHLLRMGRGAVIELDTIEGDPLRVYANNTLIARGEVKVEDGQLSVEITEKIYKRG